MRLMHLAGLRRIHACESDAAKPGACHGLQPDSVRVPSQWHVNSTDVRHCSQAISKNITLPLYYAGLTDSAWIQEQEGAPQLYQLSRSSEAEVFLQMEPLV